MPAIQDLIARAEGVTDREVLVYDRRGRQLGARSWADISHRARATGRAFLDAGLAPGDHVFLQLSNSFPLIEGFLGAIAVGLVPCCLAPPRALGGLEIFRERLRALLRHFPRSLLVAAPEVGEASGIRYLPPPDPTGHVALGSMTAAPPEALAFIQLTSGSTWQPKAVRISHGALVANVHNTILASKSDENDCLVSWLPLYHDMGLVGTLLCGLTLGAEVRLMQPETVLARPATWLRVISDSASTTSSVAPNFAYQTCVQKISAEEVSQLDLSRWRIAGCGAERVSATTLAAFAEHFEPAGFRRESFLPCYGMAETTLAVTFGAGDRLPVIDGDHVSCGLPIPGTEIVIRSAGGEPLPDGEQGEVTVRGPSLCSGYSGGDYPSPVRDGWLYTGDRGYLRAGELYITGRFKDLIIVDGVNIDPYEIEAIADEVIGAAGCRSAAFSVPVDGRERVVLVNEAPADSDAGPAEWNREIGDRVARLFGFRLYDVVYVSRGSLNKTSSGKVQRSRVSVAYDEDKLATQWSQRDTAGEETSSC